MTHTIPNAAGARARWLAFSAAFFGWMLDGYDFTILTLVLIDIQRDFRIDNAAVGALGTATLIMRPFGGLAVGTMADKWGRKPLLMLSILWFSAFSFLSGFATSFEMLVIFRALFGLGMGGEWAAGMPLVIEHWPVHLRGLVSGVLQGAFSWGFILAAVVFQYAYPLLEGSSVSTWRLLLWSGIVPALLVLWIRRHVSESPIWLVHQQQISGPRPAQAWNLADVWRVRTVRATLVLAALMFAYQSMTFWYATFLRLEGRAPLLYLVALNFGGIVGAAVWGAVADSRLGRRGTITIASGTAVLVLPLFLYSSTALGAWLGALLIGLTGAGVIGVAPAYLASQFTVSFRATGSGLAYHVAAAVGAIAPYALGVLQDGSWSIRAAMALLISVAAAIAVSLVWTGPEEERSRIIESP